MNRKMILKSLGHLLCLEAVSMVPSLCVALYYAQGDVGAFMWAILITLVVGGSLRMVKPQSVDIYAKDGLAIVGFGWLLVSFFGALPFLINGAIPSLVDALFETISGFTTTGSSILTDIEALPKGLMFWRSFTHWIGGMGFLVLMIAILPSARANNLHIMSAESPGPSTDKFVPHIGRVAKILYSLYFVLTLLHVLFLLAGKISLYDALIHAFGSAGTGGFSNKAASVGAFNSVYVEMVIAVFMLLFGVNFSLYYTLYKRKFRDVLRDEELRFYFGVTLTAAVLIALNVWRSVYPTLAEGFRYSFFQVSSVITTTGYATTDFARWPSFSQCILVLLMFIGASAGSTGGGIKCVRILLLLKAAKREVDKLMHPGQVRAIKLSGAVVDENTLSGMLIFFFLFISMAAISVLVVCLDNKDLVTSATAVFATIGNIGPGLGSVGPAGNFSDFSVVSKLMLSFCMLFGRLEIYPMLVFFAPTFWRRFGRG